MQSYEFLEELEDKIAKHYARDVFKPNPFRASSAGACARKLGYTKLYPDEAVETNMPARLLSLFQLGHQVHDSERDLYDAIGYKVKDREKEVVLKLMMDDFSEIDIKGHIDGMLEINENFTVPIDIKTASSGKFSKAKATGVPYEYKCQGQVYLDALGIDRMWFIYYAKDTSERMVLEYASDPNISRDVLNRFASVYNTTDEETLPKRERLPYRQKAKGAFTGTIVLDPACTYCPFHQQCYPQFQLNGAGTHFTTTSEEYTGPFSK